LVGHESRSCLHSQYHEAAPEGKASVSLRSLAAGPGDGAAGAGDVRESDYREILAECLELGWLSRFQQDELSELERGPLAMAWAEMHAAQQVLAAVFLQHEYLEPGVAPAPSGRPLPELGAASELPPALGEALEAAALSRGRLVLAQSASSGRRGAVAAAAAQAARHAGFAVFRARGRLLEDGRRDRVLEPLVTELLRALPEPERAELCVRRGQYLQLMAPLGYFPVRPGGVYNLDPAMNRLKLNKALLELLLAVLRQRPLCVLAEETQLFPRLGLEALGYLAWIVQNGTMGLGGLAAEDRMLDERQFLLLMTSAPPEDEQGREWLARMRQRRSHIVQLDDG
jgi:hypothetical protein